MLHVLPYTFYMFYHTRFYICYHTRFYMFYCTSFYTFHIAWFTCSSREIHDMWHFIWNTFWENNCLIRFSKKSDISCRWRLLQALAHIDRMLHVNHAQDCVWEQYVHTDSFTFHTEFLKENDQNSTWKSLHVSHNIVYNKICHKYIHIMGWKDWNSKEIATCWNLASFSMQLQRTAWNVDFIWNRFLVTFNTISYTNATWNLTME